MITHAMLSALVSVPPHIRVPLKAGPVSPWNDGLPERKIQTEK